MGVSRTNHSKTDETAFDFCVFFFICSYASCLVWFRVLKNGFFPCPAQILTESVEKGFIVLFNLVQWNRPILTTLTRDIQCEKFIEDESVSHEPCDSMYPNVS